MRGSERALNVWIRRGLWAVLVLLALVAELVFAGLQMGERERTRHIDVAVQPVPVPRT